MCGILNKTKSKSRDKSSIAFGKGLTGIGYGGDKILSISSTNIIRNLIKDDENINNNLNSNISTNNKYKGKKYHKKYKTL